jgi:hypothetical protein
MKHTPPQADRLRTALREEAADYPRVVVTLNPKWRVIECKDRLQWIVQKRSGERHGTARYCGRSYVRRRDALIRLCRTYAGEITQSALHTLSHLPAIL